MFFSVHANDDAHSQEADLNTYVQELTGRVDELQRLVDTLQKQVERLEDALHKQNASNASTPIPVKIKPAEVVAKSTVSAPVRGKVISNDPDIVWSDAIKSLEGKDLNKAAEKFKNFITTFPSNKKVVEAHYWLGELLMSLNEPSAAQQAYSHAYKNFPSTDERKVESALKIAESFFSMGKKAEGCKLLTAVRKKQSQGAIVSSGSAQLIQKYSEMYECCDN
jgi:TolA-binding protein